MHGCNRNDNPSAFSKLSEESKIGDQVSGPKRRPVSTDYYSTLVDTYNAVFITYGFGGLERNRAKNRRSQDIVQPCISIELLTGKVIGCIFVTVLQGLVVVLFSRWVLNAYWGQDILPVALLLLTYAFMTVSIGVALAFLIRSSDAASGILNTLIPVLVFLGGGYVPLSVMNGFIAKIAQISPVYWINSALFKIIYDRDYSSMPASIAINLGIAMLSLIISAIFSKRGKLAYA